MTPVEKAKELVSKMTEEYPHDFDTARNHAKECALILCDEKLDTSDINFHTQRDINDYLKYWQQVKTEIEKL
jgi:hypothetical protein